MLDIYLTCPSAQFWVYYSCFMYPAFIGAWSLFVSQTKNMNQGQSYFIWILWVFTLVNQFLIILKGEIKEVLVSHVTFPFHPCNDNLFKHILPLHCYSAIILCWLWGLARFMSFFFMLKFWWGLFVGNKYDYMIKCFCKLRSWWNCHIWKKNHVFWFTIC